MRKVTRKSGVTVETAARAAAQAVARSAGLNGDSYNRSGADFKRWAAVLAGSAASFAAARAGAFTVTETTTAPVSNVLTSQLTDASGTLTGNQDYTDNGGPPGQTFTVGGTGFYQLSGFTIQGGNSTGSASGVNWSVQIGSVDATTGAITVLDQETSNVTFNSATSFLTFNLATPVALNKGQTYEFSYLSSGGYYGGAVSATDVYAGGTAFNNDLSNTSAGNADPTRTFNGTVSPRAYDRVFAIEGTTIAGLQAYSGSVSGSWDTTAKNFTGAAYIPGAAVTFGDNDGNGNPVINRAVTIPSAVTPNSVVVNSSGTYSFNGSIQNTGFTKNNGGVATLLGNTDNTGLTANVLGGTLVLAKSSSASVHSVSSLSIANGATVQLGGTGGDQIANTATVQADGTFDLNGQNEAIDGLNGAVNATLTNNGASPAVLTVGSNNGGGTYNGNVNDGGSTIGLTKVGTGVQILTANNGFSGPVTINGGALALGADSGGTENSNGLGNSAVRINAGGQLRFGGAGGATVNYFIGNNITVDGGTIYGVDGYQHLLGVTTVTTNGATLFTRWGGKDLSFEGDLVGSGPITVTADTQGGNGGGVHFANALSFTGSIIVTGPATNTLVSGVVTNSAGGLVYLDNGNALANATLISQTGNRGINLTPGAVNNIGALGGTGGSINIQGGTLSVGANNASTTFAGNLTDSVGGGSFAKVGSGTMTLAGTGSYSGQTLIQGGTLQLAAGTASTAISGSSAVVLSTGTTFDVNNNAITIGSLSDNGATGHRVLLGSGTLTTGADGTTTAFGGTISGVNGNLIKVGIGTFTLSGAQTYTGSTIVRGGTLALTGASANNVPASKVIQAATGATLDVTGLAGGTLAVNNQILRGAGTVIGNVSVSGTSGAVAPGDNAIGTLTFNNNLTLNTGSSLNFLLGTPGVSGAPGVGSLINVLQNLTLSTGLKFNPLNNANANGQGALGPGVYELFSYGGTLAGYSASDFIVPTSANFSFSNIAHVGGGGEIDVYVSALTSLRYTGANGGVFDTSTVSFANGTTPSAFTNGVIVTFADTNPITNAPITNNNVVVQAAGVTPNSVTFNNSAIDYTISNAASGTVGISGTTGIDKNGTGKLTLAGANTFSGLVNVNAGTLAISDSNALGTSGGVTVTNGAALQLSNSINVATLIPLSITGAGPGTSGAGSLVSVSGSNTYSGGVVLNGSATVGVQVDSLTLNNPVTGTGGLTKVGAGNLALTAYNTYAGNTTVNGGTLTLSQGGQTGSLTPGTLVTVNPGATLQLNAGDNLGYGTGAANLAINGGTVSTGTSNRVTLWNAFTMTGGTLAGGTGDTNGAYSLNGDVNATSDAAGNPARITAPTISLQGVNGQAGGIINFNVARGPANPAADLVVSSNVVPFGGAGGVNGINKTGTGVMVLTGNNTYTSSTTISGGTLQFGDGVTSSNLPSSQVTNNGHLVFANPTDVVVKGVISGSGDLTKSSAGALSLRGASTYAGGTTINGGRVNVFADNAMGTGRVSVTTGTLNFSGGGSNVGNAIGIKFAESRTAGTPYNVTGVAGAYAIGNYNNINATSSTTPTPLVDSNGLATSASLNSFNSSGNWDSFGSDQSANQNAQLLNSYLDNSNSGVPETVSIGSIPYQNYDVYAYFGSDGNTRTGNVTINGTTYYYQTDVNNGGFVGLIQTSSTSSASHPLANYAVFTNQAGATLNIAQNRESNNNGLTAIEIVAVPGTTVSFANNIALNAGAVLDADAGITANLTGTLSGVGAAAPNLVKGSNAGTVALAQTAGFTLGNATVNGGALTIGTGSPMSVSGTLSGVGNLNVNDGSRLLLTNATAIAHSIGNVNLNNTGQVDLGTGNLTTTTPLNTVRGYLANAAAASFAGTGTNAAIYSSVVAADASHKSIAYISGANTNNAALNAALTNTAAVLIRPSLIGDFNIDGKVDRFDIRAFNARNAFNDGLTTHDWADGDLNFDGKVDRFDIRAFNAGNNFNSGAVFAQAQTLTSATPAAISNTTTVGTVGDGKPDLVYNSTTGDVVFKYDGYAPAAGFTILELDIASSKNSLNANGVNAGAAGSISKGANDIDYQNLGSTPIADGADLGTIFPTGLSAAQLTTNNITANFFLNGDGSPTKFADVVGGVPEPTTLSFIGIAAAGLLSRKRRRVASRV